MKELSVEAACSLIQVACNKVARLNLFGLRSPLQALRFALLTSCSKRTALRKIDRGRNIAFQNDTLLVECRIRNRYCGKKCFRVRMHRSLIQHRLRGCFNYESQVHNGDSVGNHLYYRQVVGNEYIGQLVLFLQSVQQV